MALHEINQEFESQRFQLQQASRWADQAQRGKISLRGELELRNRLFHGNHARDCQEFEELRRNLLRTNRSTNDCESFVGCKRILRSWIREQLWSDPRSQSTLHYSDSQNHASPRFWLPHDTRNIMGVSGNVFERPCAQEGQSSTFFNNSNSLASSSQELRPDTTTRRRERVKWKENRWIRQSLYSISKVEVAWWILSQWYDAFSETSISEMHLGKFQDSMEFQSWKANFKNEVCTRTAKPQITMHWIKEVKIAKSIDELMTSRSIVVRTDFPDFDTLDAMIASALKKLLNTHIHFRNRVSVEEQRAHKSDRFLRGRQIAFMIYEYSRASGACEAVQGLSDLFTTSLQNDDVQNFDVRRDQAPLSVSEMPSDVILEGLYKSKFQDSVQRQTVLALYDQETAWNDGQPNHSRLKTAVKLHIDQMIRTRNVRVRNDVVERGSVTKSQKGKKAYVERKVWECFQWKAHGQCSKRDSSSFSHDTRASGNSGGGQRRKGRSSSPASNSKAKTNGEGEKPSRESSNKEESSAAISSLRSNTGPEDELEADRRLFPEAISTSVCNESCGTLPELWMSLERQEVRNCSFLQMIVLPSVSTEAFDRWPTHRSIRGLRKACLAIGLLAFSSNCTVSKRFRSWTKTCASSWVCTSPLAVNTTVGVLDLLKVSSSSELDSFCSSSRSSGFLK